MKPEDIQFVRETRQYAVALIQTCSTTITPMAPMLEFALREAHIKLRLLTLLIESEAMKENAKYKLWLIRNEAENQTAYHQPKAYWSTNDWISARKKEILG